jgi:hypothetical protein
MFIAERLISRSSVALAVSIGYARTGGGRGTAMRSRSPDDDCSRKNPACFAHRFIFASDHPLQFVCAAMLERGRRASRFSTPA